MGNQWMVAASGDAGRALSGGSRLDTGSPLALRSLPEHRDEPAKRKEFRTQTGRVHLGFSLPLRSSVTTVESLNLFELSFL